MLLLTGPMGESSSAFLFYKESQYNNCMNKEEYIQETIKKMKLKIDQAKYRPFWIANCCTRVTDKREQWRVEYDEHLTNTANSTMSDYLSEPRPLPSVNWSQFAQGALDATTFTTLLVFIVYFAEWIIATLYLI